MEKKQMSGDPLKFLGFKISLVAFVLLFSGCLERSPDYENRLWVNNATPDTLYFQVTKKYMWDDAYLDQRYLSPGLNSLGGHYKYSAMEIIQKEYKYRGDTVEIYRNKMIAIKWAGPLREMPDSIHSFFNKNSWEIKMGGHKDDWEIATFTITEADFIKQE